MTNDKTYKQIMLTPVEELTDTERSIYFKTCFICGNTMNDKAQGRPYGYAIAAGGKGRAHWVHSECKKQN